jgi:hypothetical protein
VPPPPSPRKYWTRKGIAEWLVERLAEDVPTLVGIDHGFPFPVRHFEVHGLLPDWPKFLDDFRRHWPTNQEQTRTKAAPPAPASSCSLPSPPPRPVVYDDPTATPYPEAGPACAQWFAELALNANRPAAARRDMPCE